MNYNVRERIAVAIREVVLETLTDDHALAAAEILEAQELNAGTIRTWYSKRASIYNMVTEAIEESRAKR